MQIENYTFNIRTCTCRRFYHKYYTNLFFEIINLNGRKN